MNLRIGTAGECVEIGCDLPWVADIIREGLLGAPNRPHARASVAVRIEGSRAPFGSGWELCARGIWRRRGQVVMENVCSSGFDLLCRPLDDRAEFIFRWRPSARVRAASMARARFHLLLRAVLLQYPVMWWAGTRHRAPVHASVFTTGRTTPLLGGASGLGKSTVLRREVAAGALASSDNLCVTDGLTVWGVVEPLRVEAGSGRRMPHGRREMPLRERQPALTPDCIVLLRRETTTAVRPAPHDRAARALAAGTYMAGELRRYWGFAAALAAGTGLGPVHPALAASCDALARRLPCLEVSLARDEHLRLSELLAGRIPAPVGETTRWRSSGSRSA